MTVPFKEMAGMCDRFVHQKQEDIVFLIVYKYCLSCVFILFHYFRFVYNDFYIASVQGTEGYTYSIVSIPEVATELINIYLFEIKYD